jgi:uncharacterized heparinase superfamily protein
MKTGDVMSRLERAITFGRYMTAAKLARRFELTVRRKARDIWGVTANDGSELTRAPTAPGPLFKPRSGMIEPCDKVARFMFLGHAETLSIPGIDFSAPGPGAEYQLWRMNLHYMEYLEETDDVLWMALISAWIEANPPGQRRAWKDSWSSYALAIRVVVWMQQLVRRAARLPRDIVMRAEASLASQLRFLEHNLETDIGGNHLIKNIKALIWGSVYFLGPEATRWRILGVKLLAAQLTEQILQDGMHYERSPSYHCQVFADLLEIRHALGEDPVGGELDAALERMAQVLADLAHPDGRVALFNDAGIDMAYEPSTCLDIYERLFDRRPTARQVFGLTDAGYFGLRTPYSYFVLDCGRIAPDDLPAHGHADVLSFEWSVHGKRTIVDQGVFEYVAGDRRWRSRTAQSHNTLCLEDADQADFFGAFRCGRRPNVKILNFEATGEGCILEGTHDGFTHLKGAPRHVRRFELSNREVIVRDRIEGEPVAPAFISFLLHPEVQLNLRGNEALMRRDASRIRMTSTLPMHLEQAVWWPNMGYEEPTTRVRLKFPSGVRKASTAFQIV